MRKPLYAVLALFVLCLSLSACSLMSSQSLTDLDKARVADSQVMESWLVLAETYNDAWDRAPELRPWLEENAKPALEQARTAANAYHKAVRAWASLGYRFDDIDELWTEATGQIRAAMSMLTDKGVAL